MPDLLLEHAGDALEILRTVNGEKAVFTALVSAVRRDFQEGRLIISGERKAPAAEENAPKFRRVETGFGTFSRTFRLPETVDVTSIDAQLTDGLLRITLPLDTKKVAKHQIEVR